MKRIREIRSGGAESSQSVKSTREEIRRRSGKVSRWDIRRGGDLDVSRREEIWRGGDVSTREIMRSGKVSRWDIRSGGDLDVSAREEIRSDGDVSTREISKRSGKVSRWDIRSDGEFDVSTREEIRSGNDFEVSREETREIWSGCYLDVSRQHIRRGDLDVSRHINKPINLLLMERMRSSDVLSPPRKTREREIEHLEVPTREIATSDLETERIMDTVFSNLLLRRHRHRSLAGNEHGNNIVASLASSLLFDDEGILIEILSRLPVRSLLRFKSVCKRWFSLIKHNRHFINLHFTRLQSHPNILFITPLRKQIFGGVCNRYPKLIQTPRQCIILADIASVEASSSTDSEEKVPAEAIIHDVRMTTNDDGFVYDLVSKPVNGLICFVNSRAAAVRIYNVSTREVTPWIKSTLLVEEKNRFEKEDGTIGIQIKSRRDPVFQFGFDPSTLEHKVFCFWKLSRTQSFLGRDSGSQSYECWEALTVGRDTKWRRIDVVPSEDNQMKLYEVVPPLDKGKWHVHVNGTIYWLRYSMSHRADSGISSYSMIHRDNNDPEVIVAFDVRSEKFRVIPIPNFILDEPREERFYSPIAMLELNGRVALSYRMSPYLLKLWILDDDAGKKKENCHGNGRNWSAETIELPFRCDSSFADFHAVVGTDQIVFESYGDVQKNLKLVSLYSYDCKKKTFKKIEVDGVSLFPLHYSRSVFRTFTESLFSVV